MRVSRRDSVSPPSYVAQSSATCSAGAPDRRVYVRVRVAARDGELVAAPLVKQGSGALTSMLHANGLAMVEAGTSAEESAPVLLIGTPT